MPNACLKHQHPVRRECPTCYPNGNARLNRYEERIQSRSHLYEKQIQVMAKLTELFVFCDQTEYVSPKGYKMTIFTTKGKREEAT